MLWGAGQRIDHVPAAFIAQIRVERGDVAAAREALERLDPARTGVDHFAGNLWRRAEVEVLAAEGRLDEALAAAVDARESRVVRLDNPAAFPWRTLTAEMLDRLDRRDEAIELAERGARAGPRVGGARPDRASAAGARHRAREDGIEELEEAVEVLEGSQARLELAKALYALGVATRLARKPSEAREPLQRALELATICGATALAERARTEVACHRGAAAARGAQRGGCSDRRASGGSPTSRPRAGRTARSPRSST